MIALKRIGNNSSTTSNTGWKDLAKFNFFVLLASAITMAEKFKFRMTCQEKRLRKSINAVADPDLAGRAISLEEFIAAVLVQLRGLDKRAPETAQPLFFQKRV